MSLENFKWKLLGIIGLTTSVFCSIHFFSFHEFIIYFSEKYLCTDHSIGTLNNQRIALILGGFIILVAIGSVVSFMDLAGKIYQFILASIPVRMSKLNEFFLKDDLCKIKQLPLYLLVFGTTIGFFLHVYILFCGQPVQEGIVEKYTTLLFLLSALILLLSVFRLYKFKPDNKKSTALILLALALVVLVVFFEEISWGERIFNWQKPELFLEYNFQKETNIHNFFNPLFNVLYPIVGMGSFMVLFLLWFFSENRSYSYQLLLPHQSLFFLLFIMASSTFYGHSEIFEELSGLFLVLYSTRIYMCLRFPQLGGLSIKNR